MEELRASRIHHRHPTITGRRSTTVHTMRDSQRHLHIPIHHHRILEQILLHQVPGRRQEKKHDGERQNVRERKRPKPQRRQLQRRRKKPKRRLVHKQRKSDGNRRGLEKRTPENEKHENESHVSEQRERQPQRAIPLLRDQIGTKNQQHVPRQTRTLTTSAKPTDQRQALSPGRVRAAMPP